jgi:alkylation response protein AidB-like acyl-CoA dehydrogenase
LDFDLTSDQYRLVGQTRDYAERVIRPAAGRLDQLSSAEDFPFDLMREGSVLGLKSLPLPRDLGGIDADMVTQCLVAEELAAGDIAAAYFFRHYWRFARLVPRLPRPVREMIVRGISEDETFVPASATTEPQAGSDNALPYDAPGHGAMLSARLDAGEWVLNGSKLMITNAPIASLIFVLARTDAAVGVRQGTTMIAVPASAPGVRTGPVYRKLGQRGSLQADIFFEDCRVPADHAVTAVGEGYQAAERGLTAANITNAAMCLGVARAAYDAALDWSLDRVQGGVPIYRHQLVANDLGRMKLLLDAAHSYLMRTAWEYSWSPAFHPQLSWGVRVHAAEVAIEVTQKAMFLFGGRGIMTGNPAEKLVRDALTLTHGNGTSSLMTLRIGEQQAQERLARRPESTPSEAVASGPASTAAHQIGEIHG